MKLFTLWLMALHPVVFYFFAYCWTFAALVITVSIPSKMFSELKEWLKSLVRKKN